MEVGSHFSLLWAYSIQRLTVTLELQFTSVHRSFTSRSAKQSKDGCLHCSSSRSLSPSNLPTYQPPSIPSPQIELPQESPINTTTTSVIIIAFNMAITRSSKAAVKDLGKVRQAGPTCLRKLTKERLAALFPTLQARPIVRKTSPAAKGQIGTGISKCVQSTYTLSKSRTQDPSLRIFPILSTKSRRLPKGKSPLLTLIFRHTRSARRVHR